MCFLGVRVRIHPLENCCPSSCKEKPTERLYPFLRLVRITAASDAVPTTCQGLHLLSYLILASSWGRFSVDTPILGRRKFMLREVVKLVQVSRVSKWWCQYLKTGFNFRPWALNTTQPVTLYCTITQGFSVYPGYFSWVTLSHFLTSYMGCLNFYKVQVRLIGNIYFFNQMY